MSTYLKIWMPSRQSSNPRIIRVDSIWNLGPNKDITFRKSLVQPNDGIIEYDIIVGTKNESYPIVDYISLSIPWNSPTFPPEHQIIIRAYENNVIVDEDMVDTLKTPIS